MKFVRFITHNMILVISGTAYIILSVPAEIQWFKVGFLAIVILFLVSRWAPTTKRYLQEHVKKGYTIAAIFLSLLLGLRFERVWRLSNQVHEIASKIGMNPVLFLYITGMILGLLAIFFVLTILTLLMETPSIPLNKPESPSSVVTKKNSKTTVFTVGLCSVVVMQTVVLGYWGVQKQGYHVDEVYTFELSNYQYANYGDNEGAYDEWIQGNDLRTIIEPDGEELFNLTIPYWNSETDNHPPMYYCIINLCSSVTHIIGRVVDKWVGLLPNFLFCLITSIIIAYIFLFLTGSSWGSILVAAVWALSIGGINTAVYLRMYALLTMWCTVFTYLHLLFLGNTYRGKEDRSLLLKMELCMAAGCLSQYYFLIFAFFMCFFTFSIMVFLKNWKMLKEYVFTEIGGVSLAILFFPKMVIKLFFGDRGQEALNNVTQRAEFNEKSLAVLRMLKSEIISNSNYIIPILIICLLIWVISLLYRRIHLIEHNRDLLSDILFIVLLFTTISYGALIVRLAPYIVDRYYMCIFPCIIICACYVVYKACSILLGKFGTGCKIANFIAGFVVIAIISLGYTTNKVSYIYSDQTQRRDLLTEYGDLPVIVLNADSYDDSALKWAFELSQYHDIYLCKHQTYNNLEKAVSEKRMTNGFVLYCHMYSSDGDIQTITGQLLDLKNISLVTDIGMCPVYYCQLNKY